MRLPLRRSSLSPDPFSVKTNGTSGSIVAVASSPRPACRPPSRERARRHADAARSGSRGGTRVHRIDHPRATSAMSQAPWGNSGCARRSASARARNRSVRSASRALAASLALSRSSSTRSPIERSTGRVGVTAVPAATRRTPRARPHSSSARWSCGARDPASEPEGATHATVATSTGYRTPGFRRGLSAGSPAGSSARASRTFSACPSTFTLGKTRAILP